eukprot:UN10282
MKAGVVNDQTKLPDLSANSITRNHCQSLSNSP